VTSAQFPQLKVVWKYRGDIMFKEKLLLRVAISTLATAIGINGAMSEGATTLIHVLIKVDKPENTRALAEKITHVAFQNCKPRPPVVLDFDEIAIVIECDNGQQNLNSAIVALSQLENAQSVVVFSAMKQ
jgi:hypothetical protein